jgi:hypothetical protein
MHTHVAGTHGGERRDSLWHVSLSDSHCGAGCALGDMGGDVSVLRDRPGAGPVGRLAPLGDAIKSDTLSVPSFEVGLFGWRALAQFVIWNSADRQLQPLVHHALGFVTSWPVNRWLLLPFRWSTNLARLRAAKIRCSDAILSDHDDEPRAARA